MKPLTVILLLLFLPGCRSADPAGEKSGGESSRAKTYLAYTLLSADFRLACAAQDTDYNKYRCYSQAAADKGDIGICDGYVKTNTEGERDRCYAMVAAAKQDERLCDAITDIRIKEELCYAKVSSCRNPEVCEKITAASFRDDCYNNIAVGSEFFNVAKPGEGCSSQTHFDYCLEITSPGKREKCVLRAAKRMKNREWCGELSGKAREKCDVLFYEGENASICAQLEDRVARDQCFETHVRITGDHEYCAEIGNVNTAAECYERASRSALLTETKERLAVCMKIADGRRRDRCLARVGGKEEESCDLFSDPVKIEDCRERIREKRRDDLKRCFGSRGQEQGRCLSVLEPVSFEDCASLSGYRSEHLCVGHLTAPRELVYVDFYEGDNVLLQSWATGGEVNRNTKRPTHRINYVHRDSEGEILQHYFLMVQEYRSPISDEEMQAFLTAKPIRFSYREVDGPGQRAFEITQKEPFLGRESGEALLSLYDSHLIAAWSEKRGPAGGDDAVAGALFDGLIAGYVEYLAWKKLKGYDLR